MQPHATPPGYPVCIPKSAVPRAHTVRIWTPIHSLRSFQIALPLIGSRATLLFTVISTTRPISHPSIFLPRTEVSTTRVYISFNALLTYTYLVRMSISSYTDTRSFSRKPSPHSNISTLSLMSAFNLNSLPGLHDVRLLPLIEPALLMLVFPRFPKNFRQQYLKLEYLMS